MTIDHTASMTKHAPGADAKHVDAIIKHLGIAMKGTDSQLVACSSKSELETVRESWLKKKLKLTQTDAELDGAVKAICEKMKADHDKSRVAFYYLLAAHFGKLAAL
jgi:Protein of unknown function (DUF2853)